MGLFGLLLTVTSGGVLFADSCRTASENADSRAKARAEGRQVYVDHKGNYRLVTTNEIAYIWNDKLKLAKNSQVVYDYKAARIKMQNEESKKKAKGKGLKGCQLIYPEFDNKRYYTEFSTGRRYYLLHYKHYGEPDRYIKGYYTDGKKGISTMIQDWEDERIDITLEEYEALGGYRFQEDVGVHYNV